MAVDVADERMRAWLAASCGPSKVHRTHERNRPAPQRYPVDVANEPPLPFGQSYWDYLPDLVQDKILKMVHKQLLKRVHAELWERFSCPICKRHFDDLEAAEHHYALYSAYKER